MLAQRLASLSLRTAGWEFETPVPTVPKFVCIAAPHTSNWDGVLLLGIAQHLDLDMSWMIKDDWIKGPMGAVLRRLGAVAVNRKGKHHLVDDMIAEFARRDRMILIIPAEGTRARADYWRSGFYHIARGANVPVVPGYLDYGRKRCGMGEPIDLTGDIKADMDRLRAFYAEKAPTGHVPDHFGPIRLREEDAD